MIKYVISITIIFLQACANNTAVEKQAAATTEVADTVKFFPVTAYLKGQLYDITQRGITPIKYTTINNKTDSVLVKFEQLNSLLAEFLQPEIDSSSLTSLYTETKFFDQSVNAVTFTYDAKPVLPDSAVLRHWDVYVDPETGKVKRIYLVKKTTPNKTMQLTWQSGKWCKTVTLAAKPDGSGIVEKEEKILWEY